MKNTKTKRQYRILKKTNFVQQTKHMGVIQTLDGVRIVEKNGLLGRAVKIIEDTRKMVGTVIEESEDLVMVSIVDTEKRYQGVKFIAKSELVS